VDRRAKCRWTAPFCGTDLGFFAASPLSESAAWQGSRRLCYLAQRKFVFNALQNQKRIRSLGDVLSIFYIFKAETPELQQFLNGVILKHIPPHP
jgi:hypothetical protein